ncbi:MULTISPECIES: PH domain-containing protein [unclassified Haladaptatus]|uniref:PH domain-containing protein n=1 Tax=unclassified Haladaptatus TaxID=2622732 RepID=UPI0023E7D2A1|nr:MULTISPECIES: PH domain-containing protein [unclassified Haladaptatus]
MARGAPLVWSSLIALPFLVGGGRILLDLTTLVYPQILGWALVGFGLVIALVGVYVQLAAPTAVQLSDNEYVIDLRHPTQRVAAIRLVVGFAFLLAATYLTYFTQEPLVYPLVALIVGLVLFSQGLVTYWQNSLTSYYLTNERIISEYRFLSLVRKELPLSKVRGIQENRSVLETLVGLGNVQIAAGGSGHLEIILRNIRDSTGFADHLRELV